MNHPRKFRQQSNYDSEHKGYFLYCERNVISTQSCFTMSLVDKNIGEDTLCNIANDIGIHSLSVKDVFHAVNRS